MRALLDTHTFIWLATSPDLLSEPARRAIADEQTELFISVVTPWEIGLLAKRKRIDLDIAPDELVARACRRHSIEEMALHGIDALASTQLPDLHRDLFDRILIELALRENMALVSKDERLARYPGVRVIW